MTTLSRVNVAFQELPGGTVTFLFTDIEGSTQLLHQLRDQYATLLEDHHQIIRSAVERWHGREVDTQGDAFFVAFPKATEAIAAAAEIQRTLNEHTWPEDVQVRVRMGLHTGEPWLAGEGYVGMDVHRAARIAHVGHGGQVLLSETTAALVMDELPDGVSLLDLGRHLLKDMHRPEHIRQLDIGGLPGKFPPLTSQAIVPAASERPARAVGDPPYRGLAAFREADAPFYFGRERFVDTLERAVRTQPMVAVIVGSSGSGKSSAIFAGLLPRLKKEAGWQVASLRPGPQPFYALAAALLPLLEEHLSETRRLAESRLLAEELSKGNINLVQTLERILEKAESARQLLLVIDQFEELYTLCQDEVLQQRFIDQLLVVIEANRGQRRAPGVVLMTMRADFMGQALAYRPFTDALQEASLLMGPMNREELRSAMERPADKQGAAFETGLVERILDDVGAKPGNLPLLEFTLTQLWEAQDDGWLTHDDYEALGGVEGALTSYAEDVYTELSPEQQEGARRALIQMVLPGEGTEDTRRVATRQELGGKNWDLVCRLADKRLVVTGRDAEGRETVEVVHEALIQRWGRFQEWMEDDRSFRAWQERLRGNLLQWQESDEDQGALLSGGPLLVAIDWLEERRLDLSQPEAAYIQTSLAHQEQLEIKRARRQQRELEAAQALAESESRRAEEQALSATKISRTARLLAGLAIIAALLAVSAFLLFRQTQQNENLATSRELAASALNNLEIDPELSTLLALEAVKVADTRESQNALHQAVQSLHLIHTFKGHDNFLQVMALSDDGRLLATGGPEQIKLWDVESRKELLNIDTPSQAAKALAFSPDNQYLATGGNALADNIWKLEMDPLSQALTASKVLTLTGHTDAGIVADFSPDGRLLATGNNDATARIWDAATGELVAILSGHEQRRALQTTGLQGISDLEFNPDGQSLATAGTDGTVRLWEVPTGRELLVIQGSGQAFDMLDFSSDGHLLAATGEDGIMRVWDIVSNPEMAVPVMAITEEGVRSVQFSPNGLLLATVSRDGTARILDAASGKEILGLYGHSGSARDLRFMPDSLSLITISEDQTAKLWDVSPNHELLVLPSGGWPAYSPTGSNLATMGPYGTIHIRDSKTGQVLQTLPGHTARGIVIYSPNGSRLASGSWDGTARIWDANTGEALFTLDGHIDRVHDVAYSPDGQRLATGDGLATARQGFVRIWDVQTGQQLFEIPASDWLVSAVEFSPDGSKVAAATWDLKGDHKIKVWDAYSGELVHSQSLEIPYDLAFDPDGKKIAISSYEGEATIWDIGEGAWLKNLTLTGHAGLVNRVNFSPGGEHLATAGFDGTARIWDTKTGEELVNLAGHGGQVVMADFSPDGNYLVTVAIPGITRVFTLNLHELIAMANSRVTRTLTPEECHRFLHQDSCPE